MERKVILFSVLSFSMVYLMSADDLFRWSNARKQRCVPETQNVLSHMQANCKTAGSLISCLADCMTQTCHSFSYALNGFCCTNVDFLNTTSNNSAEGNDTRICLYDMEGIHRCPQDFVLNAAARICFKYFYANTSLQSYEDLTFACLESGGSGLILVNTQAKQDALEAFLHGNVSPFPTDIFIQGRLIGNHWIDDNGDMLPYFNWDTHQPDGSLPEHYISMRSNRFRWHDLPGSYIPKKPFICESKI